MPRASRPLLLALLAALYLGLAWPGAGERGVIAEEITPYLPRYPLVLAGADARGVTPFPPHDAPRTGGWISTGQWPNLSYATESRNWPVLIRGHQSALGTYVGLAAGPLLGDGLAGNRRSSVLLGLALLALVFALARRLAPAPQDSSPASNSSSSSTPASSPPSDSSNSAPSSASLRPNSSSSSTPHSTSTPAPDLRSNSTPLSTSAPAPALHSNFTPLSASAPASALRSSSAPLSASAPASALRSSSAPLSASTPASALRPDRFAALATLACLLSPGLLFFSRTGYAFELTSRVFMILALVLAAAPRPPTARRALALGLALAAALASRATIAATLLPALLLVLAHPARRPAPPRALLALGLGLGLPVLGALALRLAAPPLPGAEALAGLPLADLAERTWSAPAHLAAQLTWVADPGVVLGPLIADAPAASALPLALGTCVFLLALARWWRARASDGECLFVAAALGNALFGAWLYGHPQQFQLGMALEPLFALALLGQLAALPRRRLAAGLLALALLARAWQCGALLRSERAVDNPMLDGAAQRTLAADLARLAPAPGELVTTTYNHVGVLETWSSGQLQPVHAYHALRRSADLVAAWRAILRAYPVRHVVLTTGHNAFEGPFTDNAGALAALRTAAALEGRRLAERTDYACASGSPCLALQRLSE